MTGSVVSREVFTFVPDRHRLMRDPVITYQPPESLRPFVEMFWEGDFNATGSSRCSMQVIPNGCLEVIIHLSHQHCYLHAGSDGWSHTSENLLLGLFTKPFEVQFNTPVKAFAIRFKPDGIFNIFGIPASEFKETYEDTSLVLGSEFHEYGNSLREEKNISGRLDRTNRFLMKNLGRRNIAVNFVNHAAELIRTTNGIRIEDVSNRVFKSRRQLEREFKAKVGISPIHYLRIIRMNHVLRLLNSGRQLADLTGLAYDCGYSDQAHFINDFKKITGEVPTAFIKERNRFIANSTPLPQDSPELSLKY